MLHIVRYLLQNGAAPSINQPGNSALACVLRHVRDWEFRYELLDMLLSHGGNPNIVGRDGSVPLMVCLVPLINKDPLHHFTHNMKVCICKWFIFLLLILLSFVQINSLLCVKFIFLLGFPQYLQVINCILITVWLFCNILFDICINPFMPKPTST